VENVPVINNPVAVVLEPVQAPPTVTPSSYEQALTVINGLTKVQLRKLCKPLGIQQKRNDVELTKDLMAANIKKVLKSNEQLVISTIVQKLDIEIAVAKEESIESIASA
jgi:ribosomal protein S13